LSSLIDEQACNLKGGSTRPLRHDLLIFETESQQIWWTITTCTKNQKWDTPGIRNGTLLLYELSTSNKDRSVRTRHQKWTTSQQPTYLKLVLCEYWSSWLQTWTDV